MKPATSNKGKEVDTTSHLPRVVPKWLMDLVEKNGGSGLQFLMEKTLKKSDVLSQQNRLIIPCKDMEVHFLPMLSDAEKAAANFIKKAGKEGESSSDDGGGDGKEKAKRRKKEKGREHEGLRVWMYVRSGWRFRVALTRWDSSTSRVVKGDEWKMVRVWSQLSAGDQVEMWGFRQGPDKELCLVIAKKSVPETACVRNGMMP